MEPLYVQEYTVGSIDVDCFGRMKESMLLENPERAKSMIKRFHALGFRCAVDNFGADITAMQLATPEEVRRMEQMSYLVNEILSECMRDINIELIDFRLEFGRYKGQILLADEVSPDTCRFWDAATHEPMDLDRFRHDLGDVAEAYRDVLHRLTGNVLKNTEEEM